MDKVHTKDVADMLTKPLKLTTYTRHVRMLLGWQKKKSQRWWAKTSLSQKDCWMSTVALDTLASR